MDTPTTNCVRLPRHPASDIIDVNFVALIFCREDKEVKLLSHTTPTRTGGTRDTLTGGTTRTTPTDGTVKATPIDGGTTRATPIGGMNRATPIGGMNRATLIGGGTTRATPIGGGTTRATPIGGAMTAHTSSCGADSRRGDAGDMTDGGDGISVEPRCSDHSVVETRNRQTQSSFTKIFQALSTWLTSSVEESRVTTPPESDERERVYLPPVPSVSGSQVQMQWSVFQRQMVSYLPRVCTDLKLNLALAQDKLTELARHFR